MIRRALGKSIFLYIVAKVCLITNPKSNLLTILYISLANILHMIYLHFIDD